ncbi:MAG TPA: sugar transferase [Methylomirabilota bacterium]|nr:sugar transferase [Methylomirabilota bacterium]
MAVKRIFDLIVSAIALVALSPLLIVIGVSIKLDDRGAVFYRGVRIGRNGRPFRVIKFRSMRMDAERIGGVTTADDDPRITRVGWWLRKTKVDELPQLMNVLVGEMSLVGPRPEVERYVRLMTDAERVILSVAPGLTDWATLWNSDEGALLAGVADPDEMYLRVIRPEKIRLQLEYVRRRSFWIDITILLRTAAAIVLRIKPQALSLREHQR